MYVYLLLLCMAVSLYVCKGGSDSNRAFDTVLFWVGTARPCLLWTKASWLQINQSKRDSLVFSLGRASPVPIG